jgi:hypothetical protein
MDALPLLQEFLCNQMEVHESHLPTTENSDEKIKAIRKLLIARIDELISSDMERLFSILYRIDVSEKKLSEALSIHGPDKASAIIADLIIERQIQKAASRKHFEQSDDWSFDV